jgi:hypothetical protein
MELFLDLTYQLNIINLKAQPFFKKAFSESVLLYTFTDLREFLIFMGVEQRFYMSNGRTIE